MTNSADYRGPNGPERFRAVVADPPWDIRLATGRRRAGRATGSERFYEGRPAPYAQMSVDEIAAIPVADWVADDAALFLWGVDKYAVDGSMAAIARAWGFEPGRMIVWEKNNPAQGRFPLVAHELILVCRRGRPQWNEDVVFTSVQHWKQVYVGGVKVHSAKPDGMLDMVEQVSPGPYLEMFSRRARFGWQTWGNQSLHGGEAVTA